MKAVSKTGNVIVTADVDGATDVHGVTDSDVREMQRQEQRINMERDLATVDLCVWASPFGLSSVLSERPPSTHDLLLAACQSADHCICLSAEYQLINAFTATINKTVEKLLSLIEKYS
ncbi:hypothetical protein EXN66_Car010255 [Channa argus]|uniref:Uncharacterized protein n=1 Tax=Channa argus TaxID=215402 RepID=A0A6G1PWH1_CHAAH|nr:hypothetical protein EXN66_Car010255 [Channa argus]